MITLIGGCKGGSGKSTVATNIATWLAGQGQDIILLDTDVQATAKAWVDRRNENQPGLPRVHVAQATGDALRPAKDLASRYKQVVIDAGGRDSKELRSAMIIADVLIVPTKASMPDLETMAHVNELVGMARGMNPNLRAYAVISMAPTNPYIREADDAREFLAEFSEFQLAPVFIRERKVYRDAILAGQGIVELQNGQARAEIQLLCQEIYKN